MIKRDTLIAAINEVLGQDMLTKAHQKDILANGAQFLGGEEVEKVTLAVSLNEELLEQAIESNSNFCIFHHGFDPRTHNSLYSLASQKRLRLIIQHQLTIMGFHYVLDAHPTLGNNAVILRELGAKQTEPLWDGWGWIGELEKPHDVQKLADKCSKLFEHDVLAMFSGPEKVQRIGVVSGAAKPHDTELFEFQQKGVELFISGETSESTPHRIKESGIHYFACGHYATEVFGVQELGKKIKEKFKNKIEVEFIDIPNPV